MDLDHNIADSDPQFQSMKLETQAGRPWPTDALLHKPDPDPEHPWPQRRLGGEPPVSTSVAPHASHLHTLLLVQQD